MPKAVKAKSAGAPAPASKGPSGGPQTVVDDILMPSTNDMIEAGEVDASRVHVPKFAPETATGPNKSDKATAKVEFRRVSVPQHRMTPLKDKWLLLYGPVTENLKLDMRMNLKSRKVEIKTTDKTPDAGNLQRAAEVGVASRALLICKAPLVGLYASAGFEDLGPSVDQVLQVRDDHDAWKRKKKAGARAAAN